MAERNTQESSIPKADAAATKKGMVLPFQSLSLAFDHVNYYINMPTVNFCKLQSHFNHLQLFFTPALVFHLSTFQPVTNIRME